MTHATPFAGLTAPAEGVSHWLTHFLMSRTLEEGLARLANWVEDSLHCDRVALWVWPEPQVAATGLIGTSRYHEIRHRMLSEAPPRERDLVEWSSEIAQPDTEVMWLAPTRNVSSDTDSGTLRQPQSSIGALLVPRSRFFALEETCWLAALVHWLTLRESTLRDAKLAAMAEFAAGAGHEINNPLGTILGRSQLLDRKESDPERRRALRSIGGQALRIRDMISDMMVFARPPAANRQPVDVLPLLERVLNGLDEELRTSHIQLDRKLAEVTVNLDSEQFQVVVIELVRNAIRAVGRGGRIGVRTRLREWGDGSWLELDVYNNGSELTLAERIHAFDPFFSGRDAGRGLGFGLTKCWRILEQHQGRIDVHSTPTITVFRSLWPHIHPAQ